jgi:hypothetical protein
VIQYSASIRSVTNRGRIHGCFSAQVHIKFGVEIRSTLRTVEAAVRCTEPCGCLPYCSTRVRFQRFNHHLHGCARKAAGWRNSAIAGYAPEQARKRSLMTSAARTQGDEST